MDKIVGASEEVVERAKKQGIDKMDKFCNLYEEAFKMNLITKEERDCVAGQLYKASWGAKAS